MAQNPLRLSYEEEKAEILGGVGHKEQELGLVAMENIPPIRSCSVCSCSAQGGNFPLVHYLVSK